MELVEKKKKFFNDRAGEWDQKINSIHLSKIKEIFSEDIHLLTGPVLDVGCGTGILIPFINSSANNNFIVEFDISFKMLARAKGLAGEYGLTDRVNGDGHSLPFKDECFGTIICFCVYPHFDDKAKVIDEIYRCIKKGGKLIILHLKGHKELNEHHNRVGSIVKNDMMIPACRLGNRLEENNFSIIKTDERYDKYLVIAQK